MSKFAGDLRFTNAGSPRRDQLKIWNSHHTPGTGMKTADIEVSTDGVTWTTVVDDQALAQGLGASTPTPAQLVSLPGAPAASYVRIVNVENYGWSMVGLAEVQVFGTASSVDQIKNTDVPSGQSSSVTADNVTLTGFRLNGSPMQVNVQKHTGSSFNIPGGVIGVAGYNGADQNWGVGSRTLDNVGYNEMLRADLAGGYAYSAAVKADIWAKDTGIVVITMFDGTTSVGTYSFDVTTGNSQTFNITSPGDAFNRIEISFPSPVANNTTSGATLVGVTCVSFETSSYGGNDSLNGGGGSDRIFGQGGNDTINWERADNPQVNGGDIASGGFGADTFIQDNNAAYNKPDGFGRITDFAPGADKFRIKAQEVGLNSTTATLVYGTTHQSNKIVVDTTTTPGTTILRLPVGNTGKITLSGTFDALTLADFELY